MIAKLMDIELKSSEQLNNCEDSNVFLSLQLLALLNFARASNVLTFHNFISPILLTWNVKLLLSPESVTLTYNWGHEQEMYTYIEQTSI